MPGKEINLYVSSERAESAWPEAGLRNSAMIGRVRITHTHTQHARAPSKVCVGPATMHSGANENNYKRRHYSSGPSPMEKNRLERCRIETAWRLFSSRREKRVDLHRQNEIIKQL